MNNTNKPIQQQQREAEPFISGTASNAPEKQPASSTKIAMPSINIDTSSLPILNKIVAHIKENLILFLTLTGILLGITFGFLGRIYKPTPTGLLLISFPGEMLLRILKMLILPLIISSLITGLAQLDPKSSGKMGTRALGFYVMTTFIATITGISMALIIRPGRHKKETTEKVKYNSEPISTLDAILDIVRNMFPENIVQACSKQIQTSYKIIKTQETVLNSTLMVNVTTEVSKISRELRYVDGTNVMGLVVFCIIFGIFISHSKSEAQILYDFFYVMNELIMKIVALIMWYSPVGILCLVAANIIKIENMAETARRLSIYMVTVIIGLIIHALITIQLMYFLTTRKNPLKFLKGMLQAWLTAIGTASSSATLPITFRCLEENNKVDKRITRFMLPLGATINMDGTALYQCVATIFIAQLNGITLTFGQLLAICLASTATSIGVASIPSAALVTMLIVLSTVGLPTEDISYIVTVDWLLDRLRTSINVLGDAYGCGIVEHLSRKELKKLDEEAELEFAKIITATQPTTAADEHLMPPNITICDETSKQHHATNPNSLPMEKFTDFNKFDCMRTSQLSINNIDGAAAAPPPTTTGSASSTAKQGGQQQNVQPSSQHVQHQQPGVSPNPPSIVVMDAVRRRSRVLLFNNSKLPTSVYSMPHISQFANNGNNNGGTTNEDSNV